MGRKQGRQRMPPPDIEFQDRLEVFERDARSCASFAYTELTFRHMANADADVAGQMDVHAGFWCRVRAALRTALLAALARVYDERRNSHSAGQLLRFAHRHPEIFAAARERARRAARPRPGRARAGGDGVELDAAEPTAAERAAAEPEGLEPLFAELDGWRRFYRTVVQPLRPRLSGSTGAHDAAGTDFTAAVGSAELGGLAVFPQRLHRALHRHYHEGVGPVLEDAPITVGEILSGGPAIHAGWEHARTAHSVAAFLRLQRLARPLEQVTALPLDYVRSSEAPS